MSLLETSDVRKRFDDRRVLEGVDLAVEAGELVVLMGPNGAGKSVLLSCLAGSATPDDGTISLFDGCGPTDPAAKGRTSVTLQGGIADPGLTGRENIAFYRDLHPSAGNRWRELADRFGIADDLDRPVQEYSGGMVRRLEATIALSADVPLYLLDEPTAELDLSVVQTIHETIRELTDEGRTVVLSSHAPLDADVADRLVFLTDGSVVASGPPDELLSTLPTVVRARGTSLPTERLLEGQTFGNGDEQRAFLPPETSVDDLEIGDGALGERDRSTYTDLFNYYAHVRSENRSERTQ
ncbi:ABC transporter ATP-binding protein [Natronobacterium texcoconense]|uniref:ABC-2 type transport system ATP-binding protein n=1 Tax=Natronobacterium texcoconense TaxID=1095778 RepID=A0A1H1BB74_NATTX|nr:ABC transporter ATP-binding protein [Natronobacterium texcoconense]SDQ49234.1 ABC-2 type transport system ATP-binding protein [Natronobacterium texcoconense]